MAPASFCILVSGYLPGNTLCNFVYTVYAQGYAQVIVTESESNIVQTILRVLRVLRVLHRLLCDVRPTFLTILLQFLCKFKTLRGLPISRLRSDIVEVVHKTEIRE